MTDSRIYAEDNQFDPSAAGGITGGNYGGTVKVCYVYSNVTIEGFNAVAGQGTGNARFYSASLLPKSETTLRFFFTGKVTATYNGQTLEVKERSGLYYVDVVGIAAKDPDEMPPIIIG